MQGHCLIFSVDFQTVNALLNMILNCEGRLWKKMWGERVSRIEMSV